MHVTNLEKPLGACTDFALNVFCNKIVVWAHHFEIEYSEQIITKIQNTDCDKLITSRETVQLTEIQQLGTESKDPSKEQGNPISRLFWYSFFSGGQENIVHDSQSITACLLSHLMVLLCFVSLELQIFRNCKIHESSI